MKVIPSSKTTIPFINKIINILELNEYNILDDRYIRDIDGNGKYDVKDFLNLKNSEIIDMNNGHKFSVCLMNPPYDNGLGESFLYKTLQISNTVISIQPVAWLTANKQSRKITEIVDKCYANIELLNGRQYFDAGLAGSISINYIDTLKDKKLIYNNKEYNSCSEIKSYSHYDCLVEFKNIIGDFSDNIWNHIKDSDSNDWFKKYEAHPNDNWWCIKISKLRGNISTNGQKESEDFYTIISNNESFISKTTGQYKYVSKQKSSTHAGDEFLYIAFDTKQELENFIQYLKTDFCRANLMLSKTNMNMHRGCLKTVPWFDFSDSHFSKSPKEIDNWLFKKYNISNEIRKQIEEILPDYYGIRKED
jgi:hypothetical protein